jgi:hypothetical protein
MALPTLDERTNILCCQMLMTLIMQSPSLRGVLTYKLAEGTIKYVYLTVTCDEVALTEDQVLDHISGARAYASQFPSYPLAQAFCELSLFRLTVDIATRKREKAEALERHKRDSERAYKSAATRAANKAELEDRKTELENSLKTIGHVVKKAKV